RSFAALGMTATLPQIAMNIWFKLRAGVCLTLIGSAAAAQATGQTSLTVSSPDSRNEVQVGIRDGRLVYSFRRDGRWLVLPSSLGFDFREAPTLRDSLRITGSSRANVDETWTQPWGEVSRVRDHHNELRVSVVETSRAGRKFDVVFRVFNDGI